MVCKEERASEAFLEELMRSKLRAEAPIGGMGIGQRREGIEGKRRDAEKSGDIQDRSRTRSGSQEAEQPG